MYPTVQTSNTGLKDKANKPRVELIDPQFILELADVMGYGAEKYAPNSWQNVENPEDTYYAAAMRHLLAYRMGEELDKESGKSHLLHAASNLMFLAHFEREAK